MSRLSDIENPFEDRDSQHDNRSRESELENRDDDRAPRSRSRRRRWPWVLGAIALLLFLLPNIVGWLGLQQRALDYGLADFKGTISVENVSLGWFQTVRLTNVSAVDPQGNPLFKVANVTTSKTLFGLATSKDYGELNIQNPIAYIQLRPDGSNLEDAIANYIQPAASAQPNPNKPPAPEPFSLPKVKINVLEGQAFVSTSVSPEIWQVDQLVAVAETSTEAAPLIFDAKCVVTPGTIDASGEAIHANAGAMTLTSQVDRGSEVLSFNSADLLLETQNFPLSLAAPVMQRFVGPAQTGGNLNGKIQASYDAKSTSVAINVDQFNLRGFGLVAPDLIGADQVVINSVDAKGTLQLSPTIISAKQFNLVSEIGKFNANGSFDVNQISNLASNGKLLDTPFSMDGQVDLASLIRMLPNTLQLHQDLDVKSGVVNFEANSRNENGNRRLVVNMDTINLQAQRGAQNITWAQPLRLVGTLLESNGQLSLEDVECISDFLTVKGQANYETASFVVAGDLAKLMNRVGQFADLQGTNLAGVLNGNFGWKVSGDGLGANGLPQLSNLPIQIGGSFVVTNPVVNLPDMPRWQQPEMSFQLAGTGKSPSDGRLPLDTGTVQIDIGNEKLVLALSGPVADAFTNESWNGKCQMTGSVAGWLGHVQNFVDLGEISANGGLNLTCDATMNSTALQLDNVNYQVQQLTFDGYNVLINEPNATGTGKLVYDFASGDTLIYDSTINARSLTARGQNLKISFPSNMRVDGRVEFKADVKSVADWLQLSPTQDSVFWFGTLDGTVQLASNENGIGGRIDSKITDLIAAQQVEVQPQRSQSGQIIQAAAKTRAWQEVWREAIVGITGDVSMSNDFNAIGFQNLNIKSSALSANATGTIGDLETTMLTNISGTWNPDWGKVNSIMKAYTGNMLSFAGQGQQQFVIRGPLFEQVNSLANAGDGGAMGGSQANSPAPWVPNALQALVGFGWEQGEILGLPVGKSEMEVSLQQGVAFLKTTGIPFAGGTVQFAPQIDLRGEQLVLMMEKTRVIDNVALQPETARQWLKYVAPLAADATSAQGNFTVDVGGARIPLMDPTAMDARGAVRLHQVVIGAGPTAQQLLGTVKQLRGLLKPDANNDRDLNTWLQMNEQTVPIMVRNGRVYHDKLDFAHKDLVVQTSGSVGFDQSLDMIAKIPIADDWIEGKPYLASLKGQFISIPVTGTASEPKLDKRAIQQLSKNLAKQVAAGALNQAVTDKLAPKVNEYQKKLNQKIGGELNKLQGKLGDQLGNSFLQKLNPQAGANGQVNPTPGAPIGQAPTAPAQPQPSLQDKARDKIEQELKKGLGNLFGK
ncbi:MAG: hypothetical protein AB8B55_04000 [Mariniblastus sp.]